jgi:hypothetical protein
MAKYALLKGIEGTKWKNMELVATGDLEDVLSKFPGREKEYILWWLIDIDKLPDNKDIPDIAELFIEYFASDGKLEYKAPFVSGFHDDVAKSRSWGLLKK